MPFRPAQGCGGREGLRGPVPVRARSVSISSIRPVGSSCCREAADIGPRHLGAPAREARGLHSGLPAHTELDPGASTAKFVPFRLFVRFPSHRTSLWSTHCTTSPSKFSQKPSVSGLDAGGRPGRITYANPASRDGGPSDWRERVHPEDDARAAQTGRPGWPQGKPSSSPAVCGMATELPAILRQGPPGRLRLGLRGPRPRAGACLRGGAPGACS
jgi:hypothetical protein